ncbi:MAG: glycosyltransferase [Alphaproteobacteria bacterium]
MRLAIVGPAPPWRGGIALHTAEMAAAARAGGHETLVASFTRLYPSLLFPGTSQLEPGAAPPSTDDPDATPLLDSLDPLSWRRTGAAVADFRPDMVVLQRWHPFFQAALAAVARAARRAGARVAWMVHNAEPHEGVPFPAKLATLGFRDGDAFLVHAASEARSLATLGVRAPVAVLRHPVPVRNVQRRERAAARIFLRVPEDEILFLFFGYVRPYKGVDLLFDALARLAPAGPPWRAIVAGEWYVDRASADARVARPPLAGRVHLVDRYVPDAEAADLFAASDVVVLPYRDGTQSGVVPLAWAHGRPVVTTAVGGLPEAVDDGATGLLVPPGDARALADALERVRHGLRFDPTRIDEAVARAGWREFVVALEGIAAHGDHPRRIT